MKNLALSFIFSVFSLTLFAQASGITWQATIGCFGLESPYDFISSGDGNFIFAGWANDSCDYTDAHTIGREDGWLIKFDTNGNKLWSHLYGGNNTDELFKVIHCSDGGCAAVGYTVSSISAPNKGYYDYWIIKTDADGNLKWQKNYGGSSYDMAYSIVETNDSGFIVVGLTGSHDSDISGFIGGPADLWMVKLDKSGSLIWQKCMGSSGRDYAEDIERTKDGNYIIVGVAGSADHDVHFVHSSGDVWLLKINSGGDILWSKTYGGSITQMGYKVIQTKDNGYIIGGVTSSTDGDVIYNHGGKDFWVIKTDDTGKLVWQKTYGGSQDEVIFGAIVESKEGGYLFTGASESNDGDANGYHAWADELTIKINDTGSIVWSRDYGGSSGDEAFGIVQDADSSYFIGGLTNSADGDIAKSYGPVDGWVFRIGNRSASVATVNASSLKVYPTFTSDIINVEVPGISSTQFILTDIVGKQQQFSLDNSFAKKYILDIRSLPTGMYILRVLHQDKISSYKILKE